MKRLTNWWNDRGRRLWTEMNWFLILIVGLGGLLLGQIGFTKNGFATGETRTFLDNLYLTLGLLSMNTGSVPPPVSWELQVARFLVPAVAAYTALMALAIVFNEQSQQVKLWFIRDHIIICGLGRKGVRLVDQFRDRGEKVVVIEPDEGNDWIEAARSTGAIVINGDARDIQLLGKARLHRARYLIAVVGNDGMNAEIAVQAEKVTRGWDGKVLTCAIHIVEPQLWYLLREKEINAGTNPKFRLELFNIYDRGASLMFQLHPPWRSGGGKTASCAHMLLIGLGKLGQSLVVQAASRWREQQGDAGGKLGITIIDLDAEARVDALCVRYPHLSDVVQFEPLQMNVHSAAFQRAGFLYDQDQNCIPDSIYICMDDDSLGLHTGLSLYRKVRDNQIPVFIRMAEDAGLALLLHDTERRTNAYQNLYGFPLLDHTCTPDLILKGTHEALARDLHDAYLRGLSPEQTAQEGDLSLASWDELPESTKERNRAQSDRIAKILGQHGYRIVPLTDWRANKFRFLETEEDNEVESMAQMEHKLWMDYMISKGWRYGEVRSRENKTNPDIVLWEELPPEEREKNKVFIRELPAVLSRSGFQVELHAQKK